MGGCIFGIEEKRAIVFNASAKTVTQFTCLPVMDKKVLFASIPKAIEAYSAKDVQRKKISGMYGRPLLLCNMKKLWTVPMRKPVTCMIKAGSRLYAARANKISAISVKSGAGKKKIVWSERITGTPADLAVADGKLFVSTREGRLYCFGGIAATRKVFRDETRKPEPAGDEWTKQAERILDQTKVTAGYCLVVGLKDGRLVEALLDRSKLHVIAVDRDAKKVDALRTRLEAAGLYGSRAVVRRGDPLAFGLPPYLASLIVSEDLEAAGFDSGEPFVKKTFDSLRPYGGVLCLAIPPEKQSAFASVVKAAAPANGELKRAGSFTLLTRAGALEGGADWTHEAADAGNTWMSRDKLELPLGILWFGGPAGDRHLYMGRYTDPPTARITDGRMFIHGRGKITAVDAYTGRVLWQNRLPAVKAFSNARSYVQGGIFANQRGNRAKRAYFVAHKDGIYLAYGRKLQHWDAATGKLLDEFTVSAHPGCDRKAYFGYIKIWKGVIVAGAQFDTKDLESVFLAADFKKFSPGDIGKLAKTIKSWPPLKGMKRLAGETDVAFVTRCFNRLLLEKDLDKGIGANFKSRARRDAGIRKNVNAALAAIRKYKEKIKYSFMPYTSIESYNRRLLEAYFPRLRKVPVVPYWYNLFPWDGMYTRQVVGIDRRDGRVLWRARAKYSFPQESIAVGNGKVFCIDRVDHDILDCLKRRGIELKTNPRVLAFDARTGKVLWSKTGDVPGYQMFYSSEYDILVQRSTFDPSPKDWWSKPRQMTYRFIAYRGKDGKVLWDYTLKLRRQGGGHRMWYSCFLHKDTIILESYFDRYSDYYGFNLLTGERKKRVSPLTGKSIPWGFRRTRGCGKNLSCENLVLFRSSTAGYFDIAGDGGTGNLSGFRSGCKVSLIPADGILNAPNYAQGCTCNYPVFTALALAHMPEVEIWTTNDYKYDGHRVKRVGINFGAPGDRRVGPTLWLDYPSVGGTSPDIPIKTTPKNVKWFYHHSSRIRAGEVPKWIAGSGGEGVETATLTLTKVKTACPVRYTVRLYFVEPDETGPGRRVFDVSLQGKTVLENLDVFKEAGGANTGIMKEFTGIKVGTELVVKLTPKVGKTLICGIELGEE